MIFHFEMQRKLDTLEIRFCESLTAWFEKEYKPGKKGAVSLCAKFLGISQGHMSQILKGNKCWKSENERRAISKKIGIPYEQMIDPSPEKLIPALIEKPVPIDDHRKPEDLPHEEIITRFKNKEWARRMNAILLVIEEDPKKRESSEMILKALADQILSKKKSNSENGDV